MSAPVVTTPLQDPSGPVPQRRAVTWYSVAVALRRQRPDYIDARTIAVPMLCFPDPVELARALEYLGWGGYEVVSYGYQEVRS